MNKSKSVKRIARNVVGSPKPKRIIKSKKEKPEKHKKNWLSIIET